MRTAEEYAILRAARINKETAWDALSIAIRADNYRDSCWDYAWDNYDAAHKKVEELESPQN